MKIIVLLGMVVLLAIVMPIATIWSLNTLFPVLAIPLTFSTWLAAIVISGLFSGATFRSSK